MKRAIVFLLGISYVTGLMSQIAEPENKLRTARKDTVNGWQYGGVFMLNFGQTALSNWAAGGENSQSGNSFFNFFANYQKKSLTWDNTIDLGYGMLRQNEQFRKTDDKIDFSTKVGMAASKNWYYSGLLNFRSQFMSGYKYPTDTTRLKISDFLAPAYVVMAIGMDYKPGKVFTAFIAPLTGKITIVANDSLADLGSFGVDPAQFDENKVKIKDGKNFREEIGGYCKVAFQKDIMTNVNLSSKIDLFSNYIDNPQNIDVNMQVLISMKVNKFISASLSTQLIYDDDTKSKNKTTNAEEGPKIQFKEILGVGFSYRFSRNGK
jgi:hypothetical protein